MIRVSRGAEPEELQRERRLRLARAILARRARKQVDFTGYGVAKAALVGKLNEKCVFCEKDLRAQGSPVEHFRPKACVENEGEPRDDSRYWWLAWTWDNLLFACSRCNTTCKRNQFPLVPGTSPLAELSFDLDAEQPLLIDPARTEPREHIRFRWVENRRRWMPVPLRGSIKGARTIEILELEEDDHPSRHIEDRVEPAIRELRREMSRGDADAVRAMWNGKRKSLFAPRQPFHAVTWDALDAAFPAAERQRWGVELPQLGVAAPPGPSQVFMDPPESVSLLAALPDDLAMRVRAVGDRASEGDMRPLIKDLEALHAWTDDEIGRLLGRHPSTIRRLRRSPRAGTSAVHQPPDSDE